MDNDLEKNKWFIDYVNGNCKSIKEKKFGNISSFNFTRKVFFDANWDLFNVKARGLFINTDTYEIVNRSYDKFFNIGERKNTSIEEISINHSYPFTAYVKENGYLGMLGYDSKSKKMIFSTKSSLDSNYVSTFKLLFEKSCNDIASVEKYLCDNKCSFVFEVIDIENDPHIIEYDKSGIILLDIIDRTIDFKKKDYDEVCDIAMMFGINVKKVAHIINNRKEMKEWYNMVMAKEYKYNGNYIEGFVLESVDYYVKLKCQYYLQWKRMRGLVERVKSGATIDKNKFIFDEENLFYDFVVSLKNNSCDDLNKSIIDLRKKFLIEKGQKGALST